MKKWSIYMMLCSVLILTACTEDFNSDVAAPQQWEQEQAKTIGFKAEKVEAIDLNAITSEKVKVCSITKPALTAGRVKGYVLYLNEKVTLEVDSLGQMTTGALQDSIVSIYGKRPELRTINGRLYALIALGGQTLRYVPGNHQEWSPATAPFLHSTDFMNYSGFVSLDGEFKFTSEKSWDGVNYGAGAKDGTLSTDGEAGNLKVEKGFYLLKANISSLTWSAVLIQTFGLIGSATDGGWDTSTPMTFDAAKSEYSITATLKDGELKFRANDAWDINLGGDPEHLTFGGANIAVKAGTYKITLALSDAQKYTCTIAKP